MSKPKIATPYKTNDLDMVAFFENKISMKKWRKGGEFQLSQGTYDKSKKPLKINGFFPSDLTRNFEMEIL